MVLSCADPASDENAREALGQLCQIYWRPIFAFVCRRGHSVPDAQDLTQDFFRMVLNGSLLRRADPSRGRFRSLLLRSLQNFLHDAADKKSARKRGGDFAFVSWDDWMAEAPSHLTVSLHAIESLPAEQVFDLRWAASVVERALNRLREECESHGRLRVFDALSKQLTADRADVSYPAIGAAINAPASVVKRLLHQLRRRFRVLLREEVLDTVEDPKDVDDEIRYLCAALSTSANAGDPDTTTGGPPQ
jgi:RNA polymerase sigma factor (sigma-70 family)